jgi:hypothetical protein
MYVDICDVHRYNKSLTKSLLVIIGAIWGIFLWNPTLEYHVWFALIAANAIVLWGKASARSPKGAAAITSPSSLWLTYTG